MKKKIQSIKEYVDHYRTAFDIYSNVDYADMKTVRKANRAMDKMIEISKILDSEFENGVSEFAKLLDEKDINHCVAFDILDNMTPNNAIEQKALNLIKETAQNENHIGYQYWLKDWEKKKETKEKQTTAENIKQADQQAADAQS